MSGIRAVKPKADRLRRRQPPALLAGQATVRTRDDAGRSIVAEEHHLWYETASTPKRPRIDTGPGPEAFQAASVDSPQIPDVNHIEDLPESVCDPPPEAPRPDVSVDTEPLQPTAPPEASGTHHKKSVRANHCTHVLIITYRHFRGR